MKALPPSSGPFFGVSDALRRRSTRREDAVIPEMLNNFEGSSVPGRHRRRAELRARLDSRAHSSRRRGPAHRDRLAPRSRGCANPRASCPDRDHERHRRRRAHARLLDQGGKALCRVPPCQFVAQLSRAQPKGRLFEQALQRLPHLLPLRRDRAHHEPRAGARNGLRRQVLVEVERHTQYGSALRQRLVARRAAAIRHNDVSAPRRRVARQEVRPVDVGRQRAGLTALPTKPVAPVKRIVRWAAVTRPAPYAQGGQCRSPVPAGAPR